MTVAAVTAEWNCTRCGTTNRKLVPAGDDRGRTDRCAHLPGAAHRRARCAAGPVEGARSKSRDCTTHAA